MNFLKCVNVMREDVEVDLSFLHLITRCLYLKLAFEAYNVILSSRHLISVFCAVNILEAAVRYRFVHERFEPELHGNCISTTLTLR